MRALIVGISDYGAGNSLPECTEDAERIAQLLGQHEDAAANFSCKLVTCKTHRNSLTEHILTEYIDKLFQEDTDCALLYFAGHGAISPGAGKGFLATPDSHRTNTGIRLEYILNRAIQRHPGIKSTVIILDCCNAGTFGGTGYRDDPENPSELGKGVTLLAAADRNRAAVGDNLNGGLFSRLLAFALEGAAADLRGRITPAAIYNLIDDMLDKWEQRPVYKSNVKEFISLRQCAEKVPLETLRRLPDWFLDEDDQFQLSPECEPDPMQLPEKFQDITPDPNLVDIFSRLQNCNRHGLVVPVDEEHMYYAAIRSGHCRLTKLGKFYRQLAVLSRL